MLMADVEPLGIRMGEDGMGGGTFWLRMAGLSAEA